jgi:hypothetical protein
MTSGWNPQAWRVYSERVGQWWRLTKDERAALGRVLLDWQG